MARRRVRQLLAQAPVTSQLHDDAVIVNAANFLALLRNASLGAAATSLACLLGVLQIGATDQALRLAVYGAALAIPLWLCSGACCEIAMMLEPPSHGWLKNENNRRLLALPGAAGAVGLLATLCGIIHHLRPEAVYVFAVTMLICLGYFFTVQRRFAGWWFKENSISRGMSRNMK